MNYSEHIEAAESFLSGQEEAMAAGRGMLASEAVWGATAQVINAVNHARGRRAHANNTRERRRVVEYLFDKYRDEELERGFNAALRQLHNHFYQGHLSEADLVDALDTGRTFITTMIELAGSEMAELTAPQEDSPGTASDGYLPS